MTLYFRQFLLLPVSKNIRRDDITAEYIDIEARVNNKKLLEKRYLELLTKASRIPDMLSVENKLAEIRTEIEAIETQFLNFQKEVAYSSLSLTFYSKNIRKESGKRFAYQFSSSLTKGWEVLQLGFFGMLSIWPILLIAVGLYWSVKKYRKNQTVDDGIL